MTMTTNTTLTTTADDDSNNNNNQHNKTRNRGNLALVVLIAIDMRTVGEKQKNGFHRRHVVSTQRTYFHQYVLV